MEYLITALLAVVIILLTAVLVACAKLKRAENKNSATEAGEIKLSETDKNGLIAAFSSNVGLISSALKSSADSSAATTKLSLDHMSERLSESQRATEGSLLSIERKLEERLETIRQTLERNLQFIQSSSEKKLEEIQKTVDENLTKTLNDRFNESFKILSGELERVSKTIGEMQKLSSEVGVLSKVLSNVKTTGIFGEVRLGSIIDQILAPEQYVKNVVTSKTSREPVEFAVKLPGAGEGEVLLPIDSKFPYTVYSDMQTAYEQNDFETVAQKKKQLLNTVRSMARDIKEKYINPPVTTAFAVMFLPIEGLYAEVVKAGLVDELQTKYNVTVAGPTTMSALLNSLQMGFQTLAVQKKSNEVWTILASVKAEFAKFGTVMENVQKKLGSASSELDQLIGVRTRAIDRSLRSVSLGTNDELPE